MIEIKWCRSINFTSKFKKILVLFRIKLLRFSLNKNQISEDFSIKRSMRSNKNLKRIRSTKMKKIRNTNRKKNKWLLNCSGSKILLIKLMMRIRPWWENTQLLSLNMNFRKEIKICSWNNFWWRKKKMQHWELKLSNIKNFWAKFPKKWMIQKANKSLIFLELLKWNHKESKSKVKKHKLRFLIPEEKTLLLTWTMLYPRKRAKLGSSKICTWEKWEAKTNWKRLWEDWSKMSGRQSLKWKEIKTIQEREIQISQERQENSFLLIYCQMRRFWLWFTTKHSILEQTECFRTLRFLHNSGKLSKTKMLKALIDQSLEYFIK